MPVGTTPLRLLINVTVASVVNPDVVSEKILGVLLVGYVLSVSPVDEAVVV